MAEIDGVVQEWIDEDLERRPVAASELGVPGHDGELGDFSSAGFEDRAAQDRRWAARLDGLIAGGVGPDQQIDLTLLLSELAGRAVLQEWQDWRRDPSIYLNPCTGGVHSLFQHRLRPETELTAAAVARLHQVPGVVAAAQANLDPSVAPALLVRRGRDAAHAGAVYFRDLLPGSVDDPQLKADLASAGAGAAAALDDLAVHLDGLAERARGEWALGENRYSALLRQREMLGYGAAELHARGLVAWDDLDAEMTELASRVDPGGGGWRQVVESLSAEHPDTPEAMRAAYERSCRDARAFLVERNLVTLPDGERCLVEPSPLFQRPLLAVASYSSPPAFSTSRTGTFYVPYPPEGTSAEQLQERLADNSFHSIPTTSVHEAYPGHHWQLTWANSTPRPLRKVIWTSYFVEGWALYAEKMMREQGFFGDPRQELCHLGGRIFRAARVVVDTALHTGDMTVEDAVTFMATKAGLTDAVARAEVERYCSWPTQAPSYLTGSLEIERMRDRWFEERRGDLRQFHDTIAAAPGMPLALTERACFGA
ncbi:DUF885 domain-containing protein [Acidiferrimicrobium sp. IK]|uniref:DUF885 domain-containing protein n=1 Tax=Acidiferrimicrobium sp. IK TaxID=2871700 RepID=UPI0021CB726C|nr:DUF885 domain-containing protein [Acidiferrimicrobium sp. IK]MCU4184150.1 DUF885 domain-containing protein [Acidiferrimicrobium sp. IK]